MPKQSKKLDYCKNLEAFAVTMIKARNHDNGSKSNSNGGKTITEV
jgi:hypothetical protein